MKDWKENGPVLLVEDDPILRDAILQSLELSGLHVEIFESARRAARFIVQSFSGCVITDIRMDGMDGLELFNKIREIDPEIPVILMTGHGDIEMAVRAMKNGAFDFLTKPFATDHLVAVAQRALQTRQLILDNRKLRTLVASAPTEPVPQSQSVARLQRAIAEISQTSIDIRFEGEAGSGKEYWARKLHNQSKRYAKPFIVRTAKWLLAAGTLSEVYKDCQGGTLFLEGCELLNDEDQARLAGLLDERERVLPSEDSGIDFRLVVSTSDSADSPVTLNAALAFRIGSINLRVPPLRERREDIPMLFAGFVREALDQTGRTKFEMTATDRKRLLEHPWHGNIRELRNYAFGAVLNLPRHTLGLATNMQAQDLSSRVKIYEKMLISEALEASKGNVVRASQLLQTPRKTFYEKLTRHGLNPDNYRK